jgi:hypothetical protein
LKIEIRQEIFSSPPLQTIHEKNHVIAKTLRAVVYSHLVNDNPEFDFEDWEYLFYLMDASDHPLEEEKRSQSSTSPRRWIHRRLEEWKDERGRLDWLHPKNPLNTSDPFTEWMLLVLVEKLELELLDLRSKYGVGLENL